MIFFSADLHISHGSILFLGKGRPFKSVQEMNETIINNWNSKICPNDTVYYLGDLYLDGKAKTAGKYREIYDSLNGKIHFILGNHDCENAINEAGCFESVSNYKELKVSKKKLIVMMHYPLYSWKWSSKNFSSAIHGHTHNDLNLWPKRILDVGVDAWNYYPVSIDEYYEKLEKDKRKAENHHEKMHVNRSWSSRFWEKLLSKRTGKSI